MRYIIIGLGIYGKNLARDLTLAGNEVIGADVNQNAVDELKNDISTVYMVDATEESQLSVLPLLNVDLVIVAIGENFGASVKVVALLKKNGVKHIYARAIDTLHEAILQSFEIDRIITPEQRAANDLAHELELGPPIQMLPVDNQNTVANFNAPPVFQGMHYNEIAAKMSADYGLTLVAASRPTDRTNVLGISRPEQLPITPGDDSEATARPGDRFTVFGSRKALRDFCKKASI